MWIIDIAVGIGIGVVLCVAGWLMYRLRHGI